jgi:hypothetical protein
MYYFSIVLKHFRTRQGKASREESKPYKTVNIYSPISIQRRKWALISNWTILGLKFSAFSRVSKQTHYTGIPSAVNWLQKNRALTETALIVLH